jgi:hypothetical protein
MSIDRMFFATPSPISPPPARNVARMLTLDRSTWTSGT